MCRRRIRDWNNSAMPDEPRRCHDTTLVARYFRLATRVLQRSTVPSAADLRLCCLLGECWSALAYFHQIR